LRMASFCAIEGVSVFSESDSVHCTMSTEELLDHRSD
jgi:hypothetical protein